MAIILNPDGSPLGSQGGAAGGTAPDTGAGAGGAQTGGGGTDDLVKDSDTQRFGQDVIETSMQVPVIVDFWAPWCGPCKQLGPMLEKHVKNAGGLVKMVKINVDENQELAAQMRVQSIPAVYAFKGGQPVDAFMGAIPDSQIKTFIDRLTDGAKAPIDAALEEGEAALEAGDAELATQIFNEVRAQDPASPAAIGGLIRAQVMLGNLDVVTQFIDALPADLKMKSEVAAAISAFELANEAGDGGDTAEFRARLEADPNDHEARYELALALFGGGNAAAAIDELIDLVSRNRSWNEEAGRKQLVKIFDALGPTDDLTVEGRRRLSSILFS